MKIKTVVVDGKTYAEMQDGKPVYIDDKGAEIAFDAPATIATISRLNGEAKGHREAKEAAEAKLKLFDGIDDPASAKKALNTVKNLDDKKLVDAGEVEKVKDAVTKALEEKYAPIVRELEAAKSELYSEKIGGSFSRSKFIADKIAIPSDLVQARFGQNFEIKDGKIVAKDASGNQIFSPARPGEVADFDEALEILVGQYPQKDHILKGSGHKGDGARPNNGNGSLQNGGAKTMPRAEFDKLPPDQQMAAMTGKERVTVVD